MHKDNIWYLIRIRNTATKVPICRLDNTKKLAFYTKKVYSEHSSTTFVQFENFVYGTGTGIQGFGSGLDPDSIGPVDPDPDSESGSGSRRAKMTHKSRKFFKSSCFEVFDGLFGELQASSVTWTYFMEA